jgi:hypothetical protein
MQHYGHDNNKKNKNNNSKKCASAYNEINPENPPIKVFFPVVALCVKM